MTSGHSFLFNPFSIATCLARPTSVFSNCAILYAIASAVNRKPSKSMLALALAAYLSLYPALLLPPLILLCHDQIVGKGGSKPELPRLSFELSSIFCGSLAWFLAMSYLLTGQSWEFLRSTYGVHLLLPDLTPNVGLWWYFFIEMFDSFREFFLGVFWLHLLGYVGGLCFRLRTQPLFVLTTIIGIFAIFQPYPSIADASLYFALLPLYNHVFPCELCPEQRLWCLLTEASDALYIFRNGDHTVCDPSRPSLLLPVDLRWIGQRELLLCHHPSLESWSFDYCWGVLVCSASRRVGDRTTGDERQGRPTNIIT